MYRVAGELMVTNQHTTMRCLPPPSLFHPCPSFQRSQADRSLLQATEQLDQMKRVRDGRSEEGGSLLHQQPEGQRRGGEEASSFTSSPSCLFP